MNIQIFGKSKCFDTKKAERYFKERRIKFQSVDLKKYGMSKGELTSVKNAVGLEALIDPKHPDAALLQYLTYDADKLEKLLDDPTLLRTSCATASKPLWATAPTCGRSGPDPFHNCTQKKSGKRICFLFPLFCYPSWNSLR